VPVNKKLKLYLDTSIPNHLFADDVPIRKGATHLFFQNIEKNKEVFEIFVSDVVIKEIERAPSDKKAKLLFAIKGVQVLEITDETDALAKEYIKAGIIPAKYEADAYHIAIVSVYNLDVLISWNFEHMVNLKTRRMVNAINELKGYKHIEIVTPEEV